MYAGAPTSVKTRFRGDTASRIISAMTTVADPDGQLTPLMPDAEPTASDEHIELVEHYSAHNYHPLPIVVAEAEGAWVTDVDGKRYLDMLVGLLGPELRPPPPRPHRHGARPARPGDPDEPGVPQRPDGPVLPGPRRALRHGDGAADELGRRGRRDRGEDRAALGLRREGRARGPREDRHLRRQLPRAHDHDRELLDRPERQGRVRTVHPRVRDRALRRRRGARDRARRPRRRGVPRRADPRAKPGSSCRPRATCGVPASSATSTACC